MTRLEAIEEEIRKLSPDELAELRDWLGEQNVGVQRPGQYTSTDIHRVLFPGGRPEPGTCEGLGQDLEESVREKRGKSGNSTFEDIRREIFPTPPRPRTPEELNDGIEEAIREKHGRR